MIHGLKILPKYYEAVATGNKNFEVRKNDRNFKVGDYVYLKEFENRRYTGRGAFRVITYVLTSEEFEGIADGYCVFGMI